MASKVRKSSDLRKCRLCFCDEKLLIYIFEVSGSLKNIARTISDVLNYKISIDDHFPPFICTNCSDKLHEFKDFKAKCDSLRETYELLLQSRAETKLNCSIVKRESDSTSSQIKRGLVQEDGQNSMQDPVNSQHQKVRGEGAMAEKMEARAIVERNMAELDCDESTVSSDLRNHLSLDATEETVVNTFEGESICTTEDNSFVISDANEGITEEYSRDEVVPEEEATSVEQTESILKDTELELSHLKAPLSKRKSAFICDICKKSFTRKWDMGNHVRIHNHERPFNCNVCRKTFKRQYARYVHELRHLRDKMSLGKSKKGSKENLYSCSVCAKNFSTRIVLREHSNSHSDKYKCNFCGKCFRCNAHLNRHIRIHTKEKPFKCEVCSKCFTQKSDLNSHLHIHSSEKSFSCDICDKRFKTKKEKTVHELYHLRKK